MNYKIFQFNRHKGDNVTYSLRVFKLAIKKKSG